MEFLKKYALAIVVALIGLAFLIALGIALFGQRNDNQDSSLKKNQELTVLNSPFAGDSDRLAVNYGGDADPNVDAVTQRFKVFAAKKVPAPDAVRQDLETILPGLMNRELTPTYPLTFIHVNPASIKCDPLNNCTMLVYVDSPEALFELKTDYTSGEPDFKLTQKPWKADYNEQ